MKGERNKETKERDRERKRKREDTIKKSMKKVEWNKEKKKEAEIAMEWRCKYSKRGWD